MMGDVIPFPRIYSRRSAFQVALLELEQALMELVEACNERDRIEDGRNFDLTSAEQSQEPETETVT